MKYVLLLTIWGETTPVPEVYVLGHALTGEECIAQLEKSYQSDSLGTLSCEVDYGHAEGEQ